MAGIREFVPASLSLPRGLPSVGLWRRGLPSAEGLPLLRGLLIEPKAEDGRTMSLPEDTRLRQK